MLRPCHAQRVRRRRRGVILPFYLQARRATPGGWLSQTIELLEMGAVKSSWDYTGGISCTDYRTTWHVHSRVPMLWHVKFVDHCRLLW
jgi:hypothetical protein